MGRKRARGEAGGLGGGARTARESKFVLFSGASAVAGPLCWHCDPWLCLWNSRVCGALEVATTENGTECPPTAASVSPSQRAGIAPALLARKVAELALPLANIIKDVHLSPPPGEEG